MYTPLIGRRLLDRANLRDGTPDRTPAEFFVEEFHRLVFDDEQYLMAAGNSKFGQFSNWRKKQTSAAKREGRPLAEPSHADFRVEALADFRAVAEGTEEPFMHLVAGGYAEDHTKTTSGQVTGIDHAAAPDDVYLSWIGAASGVRVGKVVLLIDHDAVLDAILEGWTLYRRVLTETPGLKANQLETWNGQWLRHRFSSRYDPTYPVGFVTTPGVIEAKTPPSQLTTVRWARLFFALGGELGEEPVPSYVCNLVGQTNTTIGFIRLDLGATGRLRDSYGKLRDFYRGLFGDAIDAASPDQLDLVYEAGGGFADLCMSGTIGLRAFQPRKLRDFLPGGKGRQPKPVGPADAQTPLLYQTWIHAMLGDKQSALYDRAHQTAERFLAFETGAIRGKTNLKKSVKEVLKASSIQDVVDGLTQIADDVQDASKTDLTDAQIAETLDALDGLVRDLLALDYERFRLFLALLRFQVALLRGRAAHAAETD